MTSAFAYDVVDYPPLIHAAMHPARLAAIARLHGIDASSPAACSLLEVGCGDGLQLLTLAQAYPDSRFVGVDLSEHAVARGERMRHKLGLSNLTLVAADLLEWQPAREFDYIVAHGFHSWVPGVVRERLLAVCGKHLAPAGIAYISYNAMPGCHLRRMVWDMLRFHVASIEDAAERMRESRRFLEWLARDVMERGAYGPAVRAEAERLLNETHPAVVFHDDLAAINDPFSLTEFAGQAARHQLAFLAEADYHEMNPALLGAEAQARYHAYCGDDRIANDQYLDFIKGRRFRQSLLCRQAQAFSVSAITDAVLGMDVVGHMRGEMIPDADNRNRDVMRFANPDGAALSTDHAVCKLALARVASMFPAPIAVADLLDTARRETGSPAPFQEDANALCVTLAKGFELGLLSLQVDAPRFACRAGERPLASPLARLQVDDNAELITNLRPSMVRLDSRPAVELLKLLDGTRDRAAILQALCDRMSEIDMPGEAEGSTVRHDADWWNAQLGPTLEDALALCLRTAMLVEE